MQTTAKSTAKPGGARMARQAADLENGAEKGEVQAVDPKERIARLTELLSKLDDHAAKLAKERARVAAELSKLLSKINLHPAPAPQASTGEARAKEASAKIELLKLKDSRGKCAAMCIEEIERVASYWSSSVSCVALGESSTLLLYDNAPPAFTTGFAAQCPQLTAQIGAREESLVPAEYAAIGTEERFYIRWAPALTHSHRAPDARTLTPRTTRSRQADRDAEWQRARLAETRASEAVRTADPHERLSLRAPAHARP
jgi:hypothetical protein